MRVKSTHNFDKQAEPLARYPTPTERKVMKELFWRVIDFAWQTDDPDPVKQSQNRRDFKISAFAVGIAVVILAIATAGP